LADLRAWFLHERHGSCRPRALSFANTGSATKTEAAARVVSFTEKLRFCAELERLRAALLNTLLLELENLRKSFTISQESLLCIDRKSTRRIDCYSGTDGNRHTHHRAN
jgi:hypothetical protein